MNTTTVTPAPPAAPAGSARGDAAARLVPQEAAVVLSVINNNAVTTADFVSGAGAVALKPEARRAVLDHYERRMDTLVGHPVFGYRVSYRRILEVQARLLSRLVLGEISEYPSFRTR